MAGTDGSQLTKQGDRRYRLVIADDHPEMRREVSELLNPEFEVARAVGDGMALVEATSELKPDAVISDIQMPGLDGIEAGCRVLARGSCSAIIVLSMYPDRHLVETAMRAGILGYVLKLDASEELIPAVYAALRGEHYLSTGVRRHRSKLEPPNQ